MTARTEARSLPVLLAACDQLVARLWRATVDEPGEDVVAAATLVRDALDAVDVVLGDEGEPKLARVFHGDAAAVGLPELMQFLHGHHKSGVLHLTTPDETFRLEFRHGELVHAASDNAPAGARLGDILVERGTLAREELDAFLTSPSAEPRKLGAGLEDERIVTREELRDALICQIQRLFDRLFDATDARFSFVGGEVRHDDGRVRLNVTPLLLESARKFDEDRRG